MKILALGGAGAMGAVAVRTALGVPGVDEIVIADRDFGAAEDLAQRSGKGDIRVRAVRVDVTDQAMLRTALESVDLVLNTVGPYFRFGLTVLRAAIETRTHYLDICDDWEPTLQMLGLDAAAREQGVCAVIGMGASPGISNLLAATAAAELDAVQDVYTAWPVDVGGSGQDTEGKSQLLGPDGRPSAAAVHWMEQASGTITGVSGGQLVKRSPLSPISLNLPAGHCGTAYSIGHPEPITLQRTLKPGGDALNLMVIKPWTVAYLDTLRRDMDAGLLSREQAAEAFAVPALRRVARSAWVALRLRGPGTLPPFFAAVTGERDGYRRSVLSRLNLDGPQADPIRSALRDMALITGVPLAMGMAQVIDGSARRPGVHPPEAVIEPERFFTDFGVVLGCDRGVSPYVIEQEALS
ncbi:saccharopine dehydrogenase family protein [Mycobacteroides immunogenum]|uniref:Saccharopine dehydrogenase n=1 Tax=Mycobacteroides immunogenum TaxID=83262 RepID=A0A7V8LKG0_9MYCO|nr:saccharopine dehydrogenase NADP-binding domain-containing protein [Mycobacteroides immunogenum]AMT69777.1 saccharopine dehydrogenase [Mycobacteroides immunogenum]ANO02829.1 saccharopine dehydrogenase [Mycobacteroides immunogenum]KIU39227.1 saccharopine dehydrogenase [Mycobacteroides immunogenum]KPG02755.1 saccharopine dehydrogenase [Mycobacteroides immunogenum]KPG03327.1 saccharopine dehydrogenase [Mycobacteroides immunogenum]